MTDSRDRSSAETTDPATPVGRSLDEGQADYMPALALAWSRSEPERIGEVALLPRRKQKLVLGRGSARHDDTLERVELCRQRPGKTVDTGPLDGKGVSRRQLEIDAGEMNVTRVGRCPLRVNGEVVATAQLRPGDVVTLENEYVFLCTRRPRELPAQRFYGVEHATDFGEADDAGLVGESGAAWELRDQLAFCARSDAHVLITGESGTGKELAAGALHALSARAAHSMVSRNAATFPESLVDVELFGSSKGYPNPGSPERLGIIGEADGSTLFLDEIAELPQPLQAHLLRVLDRGEYHRLGESKARRANLRVVAATNRAPESLKRDLLARLTLRVEMPGLQDRPEDIPLLFRHLLRQSAEKSPDVARLFCSEQRPRDPRVHPDLVEHVIRHRFTHHVRELDAILWRAIGQSHGEYITLAPEDAKTLVKVDRSRSAGEPTSAEIREALEKVGGSKSRAWQELGLSSRYALYRLLRKHGLDASTTE